MMPSDMTLRLMTPLDGVEPPLDGVEPPLHAEALSGADGAEADSVLLLAHGA